jgi:phospholipid/cholesterol/gamma-HCH transport system substrate-binding protein
LLQFAVFTFIAAVAIGIMVFGYMKLPNLLWGAGHYKVTLQLPETGGLYPRSNVTYRGTQVGRVESVHLDEHGGVSAILSLTDDV